MDKYCIRTSDDDDVADGKDEEQKWTNIWPRLGKLCCLVNLCVCGCVCKLSVSAVSTLCIEWAVWRK